MELTNKAIIKLFRSVAAVYLLKGENRFKIIAYQRAADTIDHLNRELKDLSDNGELDSVSGIGPSIRGHIEDYFKNGEKSYLIKTIRTIPQSVFVLMDIAGIGPKKALKLTTHLHLTDPHSAIADLKSACETGKVAEIESFGEKSAQEIYTSISQFEKTKSKKERISFALARTIAYDIIVYLKKNPYIKNVEVVGSLRRGVSTVGDIDILIQADNHFKNIIDYFTSYSGVSSIIAAGTEKASIMLSLGRQIDIRIVEKNQYGSMLQYFTGSKEHNIKLREYALKKGYSLSEHGIKNLTTGKIRHCADEKNFYSFLGLDFIPPELREGTDEIEKAQQHTVSPLIELKDIRGDFHIHSSYDLEPSHDAGINTYVQLLEKAQDKGYEYIACADHNPSLSRHTEKEIIHIMKRRKEYIVQKVLNKKLQRIHFFISLEVDILPDGEIALPDDAITFVDFLIVAIHSSFRMSRTDMTNRILKALEHPKVKILAHPTTRLINQRSEIDADWQSIFRECREKNIAMEINASPSRLDFPDVLVRRAIEAGVKLVINTDAHAATQMDDMQYGVSVARRGWAKKSDIVNTMNYNEIKRWINR